MKSELERLMLGKVKDQETKRLKQIERLKLYGLATWREIREETEILRRQVLRDMEDE